MLAARHEHTVPGLLEQELVPRGDAEPAAAPDDLLPGEDHFDFRFDRDRHGKRTDAERERVSFLKAARTRCSVGGHSVPVGPACEIREGLP